MTVNFLGLTFWIGLGLTAEKLGWRLCILSVPTSQNNVVPS